MRAEGVEQQCAVRGEQLGVRVADALEQARRAFDIAEEQGDRAGRKLGHGPSTMAGAAGYVRLIVVRASSSRGPSRSSRNAAPTPRTPRPGWEEGRPAVT